MKQNELKVQARVNTQYIDSREVAEMLEKQHKHLLRDIKTYCGYLNESNFGLVEFFLESQYVDAKGETRQCYQISRKGCEFLAHKLTGKKGALFTAKYIERFHQMEEFIDYKNLKEELHRLYGTPRDYQESLLLLVEKENKIDELEQELKSKDEEIKENKPKIDFYDHIGLLDGDVCMADVAKLLHNFGFDIGRTRFMEWLKQRGYLCKGEMRTYNKPKQSMVTQGYMKVKSTVTYDKCGRPIRYQNVPVFTPKGVRYISKKYIDYHEKQEMKDKNVDVKKG